MDTLHVLCMVECCVVCIQLWRKNLQDITSEVGKKSSNKTMNVMEKLKCFSIVESCSIQNF